MGLVAAVALLLYLIVVLVLLLAGRRQATALAGFVPDCALLFARLARDSRLPRRHKLILGGLAAYLAMPFDLVPDFIPIAGQLDDAILVAWSCARSSAAAVGSSWRSTGPAGPAHSPSCSDLPGVDTGTA